jgi:hypothetical protein
VYLNSIFPKDGGDGIGVVAVDCIYGIAVCGGEHLSHLLVAHLFCLITCIYRLHRSEQQKHRHQPYRPHAPPQPRRIACEHHLLPINSVALASHLRHIKSSLSRHWRPSQTTGTRESTVLTIRLLAQGKRIRRRNAANPSAF